MILMTDAKKTSRKPILRFRAVLSTVAVSVILLTFILRYYNLEAMWFRFADEGYHLLHAAVLDAGKTAHTLYFKHGLIVFLMYGLKVFGFTVPGALNFSVFCGILTIVTFFYVCRRFLAVTNSLVLAAVFSSNYYIFYYQRSNMSDGYALMFFMFNLFCLITSMQNFDILNGKTKSKGYGKVPGTAWSFLVMSGILTGFSFTVRIQTCLTAAGVFGALGIAVLLEVFEGKRKWRDFRRLLSYAFIWIISAAVTYALFMYSIRNDIRWASTFEWYRKNLVITEAPVNGWKLYIFSHLFHLCSVPFLVIATMGIFSFLLKIKRLNTVRRWMLICFIGLSAGYLKMAMPWPRAYLYLIVLLVFFWGAGLSLVCRIQQTGRIFRRAAVVILLIVTAAGELLLILPFISKTSGYRQAAIFMGRHGPGNYYATHAWPIFSVGHKGRGFLFYPTYNKHNGSYRDLAITLKAHCDEQHIRYLILDNNVSNYFINPELLEQFVVTYLPDAVFKNDFGEDYHTCMDAFGTIPNNDLFTDKIMIYDLSEMEKLPRTPIPYYDDKRMSEVFNKRWKDNKKPLH